MEEIKQKVQDLELALNYVCYDASLIPKLTKVWEKLELLQEAVNKKCTIHDVIERFSGENLMKLQKHFVSLYGSDEMAQEKANSFAVGFGKACELMIKELNAL